MTVESESEDAYMIPSVSVVPECNWSLESCSCGSNDHTLYAVPRHKLVPRMSVTGRGMEGQLVVIALNKARVLLDQKNTHFWKISDSRVVTVLDHAMLSLMMRVVEEVMGWAKSLIICLPNLKWKVCC